MVTLANILGLISILAGNAASQWQTLSPGMDLRIVIVGEAEDSTGGPRITVVRIDPRLWEMELVGTSRTGVEKGLTAREWCRDHNLTAAINAGMFAEDHKTHIGYLRFRDHVNSSRVTGYQSVAAFEPIGGEDLPLFRIFDLDAPGVSMQDIQEKYASVVQNLRLIKRPGSNQWKPQDKKWTEAALGEDGSGRVLFIFCAAPLSMYDLNQALLASGIGLVAAQHLEGGSQAQLYLKAGDTEIELAGGYRASFQGDGGRAAAWPIPNALGVRPRPRATR